MSTAAQVLYVLLLENNLLEAAGDFQGFIGYLPDLPDNAITLYDTEGIQDGRIQSSGERIDHPGVQVTLRGTNYPAVSQHANQIASFLDAQKRISIAVDSNDTYILHNVKRTGTLNYLGVETQGSKRRHIFTLNMVVTLKQN